MVRDLLIKVMMSTINDEQWLAANLAPETAVATCGMAVPALPPDDVQCRFTGSSGRANLQQAFEFYKFVLAHLPREERGRYRVVDFGGGWGRVIRLFLREYESSKLVLLDCLTDAVECARSLKPPFQVLQTNIRPPVPLEEGSADACIAYSVFSHLSEEACTNWIRHLGTRLVPGGRMIFTTRGRKQIDHLRYVHRQHGGVLSPRRLARLIRGQKSDAMVTMLPKPDVIRARYAQGTFQFYPTGGGGELTDDFYGETWIPEAWMKQHFRQLGFSHSVLHPEAGAIDQTIFVLTK